LRPTFFPEKLREKGWPQSFKHGLLKIEFIALSAFVWRVRRRLNQPPTLSECAKPNLGGLPFFSKVGLKGSPPAIFLKKQAKNKGILCYNCPFFKKEGGHHV